MLLFLFRNTSIVAYSWAFFVPWHMRIKVTVSDCEASAGPSKVFGFTSTAYFELISWNQNLVTSEYLKSTTQPQEGMWQGQEDLRKVLFPSGCVKITQGSLWWWHEQWPLGMEGTSAEPGSWGQPTDSAFSWFLLFFSSLNPSCTPFSFSCLVEKALLVSRSHPVSPKPWQVNVAVVMWSYGGSDASLRLQAEQFALWDPESSPSSHLQCKWFRALSWWT